MVPWREDDGRWFLSSSRGTKTVEVIPIAFQHLPPWIQGSLVGRYTLSMLRARKGAGQESKIISTISIDDGRKQDRQMPPFFRPLAGNMGACFTRFTELFSRASLSMF